MSRQARILATLEGARSVSTDELAEALEVSRRTVVNEIAALQDLLGTAASLTSSDARWRLMVADPPRYRAVAATLADRSFNNPDVRVSTIVAKLFRSLAPVRIDELATDLAVGRTTVIGDLGRARALLEPDELTISGRTNVGLTLEGEEFHQRLHVLRHHWPVAYPADERQEHIATVVRAVASGAGLEQVFISELTRWATVAVDRLLIGSGLSELPARCEGLGATPAHQLASRIAVELQEALGIGIDEPERVFLTLPIAGMRAPADPDVALRLNDTSGLAPLVDAVLEAVRDEMDIDLRGARFLAEFERHLAYMLNRMRYHIWIDAQDIANVKGEFPVAHRMALVASRVIGSLVGLPVDDSEIGFLAAYFQVFLEAREQPTRALRVIVVAVAGRLGAELVRLQLAKLLPVSTRYELLSVDTASPERLRGADLVVVAGDAQLSTEAPILHVTRVLDQDTLGRQLERLQLRIPLAKGRIRASSALASTLDEQHFFALPEGTDYEDAVEYMTGHLEARGLVEAGFGERIRRRERRSGTELDPWLGFPHATLHDQQDVVLAIGVIPRADDEPGIRLIVLLGVPRDSARSDDVLVQVYDEVLRLGARRDLLTPLSRLATFEECFYFLERNTPAER